MAVRVTSRNVLVVSRSVVTMTTLKMLESDVKVNLVLQNYLSVFHVKCVIQLRLSIRL